MSKYLYRFILHVRIRYGPTRTRYVFRLSEKAAVFKANTSIENHT